MYGVVGGWQRWVKKKLTQQLDVCCIFLYVSLGILECHCDRNHGSSYRFGCFRFGVWHDPEVAKT